MSLHRLSARAFAALFLLLAAFNISAAAPQAGDTPPDVVGITLDREPVLLSKYAGKAVVISFWATWCPYCLQELPILSGIQKAAKGNVQVIAINTEKRDVFRQVNRALRDLDMQLAYDPDQKAQAAYGVKGIPHMVIIGRDGKIVEVYRGYSEDSLPAIVDAINRATGATQ